MVVKGYAGGDLSVISNDSGTSDLSLKLQIGSGTSFSGSSDFVSRVSDADVIDLASGSTLLR